MRSRHLPNVLDSGRCRKELPNGCGARGRGRSPGPRRQEGRGRLRTSGVRPIPSRRRFASGRSGPAAGRGAVGRLDGTRRAPPPASRGRSRAGALRRGARARLPPPRTGPGRGDSAESPVETVEPVGRRRGVGAARPYLCPGRAAPRGARRKGRPGAAGGDGAEGPRAAAGALEGTASTTASPGFSPEARRASGSPTPGVEAAGGGRARGGASGAASQGPLRAARPLRAATAPGPRPEEAGPPAGELRARSLQRGSLPRG